MYRGFRCDRSAACAGADCRYQSDSPKSRDPRLEIFPLEVGSFVAMAGRADLP